MKLTLRILRYVVAFLVITYGFAKLNGSQFTILDSELDKPLGQVSGFWLTWYYFGYSQFYGTLIALAQILGGVLLMFGRTTLFGACLLLPIIANIILVDIFYQIDLGALVVALFIELALLFILGPHLKEIYDLFWVKQKRSSSSKPSATLAIIGKYTVRALLIVIPAIFTYWVANYNNRFPTVIDGAWDVVGAPSNLETTANTPSVIFFERNRAHLCVFKNRDGSYQWHHFELNPQEHTIAVWERWLQKGAKMYEGHYENSGTSLVLKGRFANNKEDSVLTLRKRS